jgi:SAM-dependent methyltransferase
MIDFISSHWSLVIQGVLGAFFILAISFYLPIPWGAPWVPTPSRTAAQMLKMAGVKPGEKVVDLGAGDGRLVILAARKFGARAVGVEIDPFRWLMANLNIRILGLQGKARVVLGDRRKFDPTDTDVVVLYLQQGTNQFLKDRLSRSLKPGARVVSHAFSMSGWTPIALDDLDGIFVYEIGNTGEGAITKFF